MNEDLQNLIKKYTMDSHREVSSFLIDKSKDNLISMLLDMLTMYINDKNSSTLREVITVWIAGYKHSERKIGFNGFRQNSVGETEFVEAKPKNFDTTEIEKFNLKERKTRPQKLNGYGNFSDYTHARLKKDKKENLNMLVSGFVNGKLIYVFEFPFKTKAFIKKLNLQLKKRFPDGDKKGQFLRSASFDYRDFIDSKESKIIFLLKKKELNDYKNFINNNFYKIIYEKAK